MYQLNHSSGQVLEAKQRSYVDLREFVLLKVEIYQVLAPCYWCEINGFESVVGEIQMPKLLEILKRC